MIDDALTSQPSVPPPNGQFDVRQVDADEYQAGFGESIERTLDLDTWKTGEDLATIYGRIAVEVEDAIAQETQVHKAIRERVFPQLGAYPGSPPGAGVYTARPDHLELVHRGLLLNAGVEACDGTILLHDTVPLTIAQIGISLVSYQGDQGTWSQRLFRRDLRASSDDPVEEMLQLLERRERRGGLNQPNQRDVLSVLMRRGLMAYGERAILLRRSSAPWRMGHGSPAPYELLTGSGSLDLMIEATKLIRELVEQHQKFVFVASEPSDRVLLTIGQALRPLEFAIVGTLEERIRQIILEGHSRGVSVSVDRRWDGEELSPEAWLRRFLRVVGPQVVYGVYRASHLAPPQMFYAHRDHADLAAHIAIADSTLQVHRGFPMLIDIADRVCRSVFGSDTMTGPITAAYVGADAPWRYESERATRSA